VGIEIPLYDLGVWPGHSVCKAIRVTPHRTTSDPHEPNLREPEAAPALSAAQREADAARDISDVPAVEVVTTLAVHLMTAAAVKCGLSDSDAPGEELDLAEARILITALAGLVTASYPYLGSQHAAPLRDGLTALQRAFREASSIPDAPGDGPGEKLTGPVTG
jgi:hypothetical protein